MFMKVYQCPPRRGNGSYWTLLSDGDDELKRAIPLFSTLQPPIIDENSVYNRVPSTHIVKSKGQYVPVLPSTESSNFQPYFAIETTVCTMGGEPGDCLELPVVDLHLKGFTRKGMRCTSRHSTPQHLLDHSYALVEGQLSESSDHETTFDAPTPKRKQTLGVSVHKPQHEHSPIPNLEVIADAKDVNSRPNVVSTPPSTNQQKDDSLGLLDSSFLTPVKNLLPEIDIGTVSLSPLYNFVTPKHGNTPVPPSFPSPFTPFGGLKSSSLTEVDSGIFSTSIPLDSLKFSTPVKNSSSMSDFLPPNTFSTPQDTFPSLKVLDPGFGSMTPFHPGSLQPFGLPGFTPPSSSHPQR